MPHRKVFGLRISVFGFRACCLLLGVRCLLPAAESPASRSRVSLNADWRFIKGDPEEATGKLNYATLKPWLLASAASAPMPDSNPGADVSYTQAAFDDSGWRRLSLPHDWGIEGPFKQEYPGETGKLPWWGVGWYRKHFDVPAADQGRLFFLDLDGAMAYASVWLNGHFVGGWPYGYSSWRVDLTPFIKPGSANVLAIRLDNPPDSSRWYPGGGIYRNVWLVKTSPIHVANWGSYLTTTNITKDAATVTLSVSVENSSPAPGVAQVKIATQIYELNSDNRKSGRAVASLAPAFLKITPGSNATLEASTTIRNPKLWDLKKPNRYVAVTTVGNSFGTLDTYETPFGIRTIQFTADNGFLLNGRRVPLNGVCDHHDLGALGSAINVRGLERQIESLQEMGCNAVRTSHNPPAPELLDVCDRLGMVVMDEAFDCWLRGKKRNDYHLLFPDWHEQDLRSFVRRDRNHPCVILWSIGNEIPEQGSANGLKIAAELAAIVHSEDPTRPVTAGCNNQNAGYNGFQKQVDVFGYNYKPKEYGKVRQANPALPVYGSETASCISSRGEYFFPVSNNKNDGKADFQMSSYDLYAPPWATTPDTEFHGQDEFQFVAGEFVWTGFDYLGEPTPYNSDTSNLLNFTDPAEKERLANQLKELGKIRVPSRSSYFGIIDLAGFKKDRFYIYQARWRPDFPIAHVLPHWNWPDRVGQVTPVHLYTSGDEAELFLNGKSLGRKKKNHYDYRLRWDDVTYQPGELKAVAYKNGKTWARDTVRTTGPAAKLTLQPDHTAIAADGQDLSYVTVTITDQSGQLVPRSKNRLSFTVSGPGEIIATDNGDATSFEPFQSKDRNAYNGLCLVIVRSTGQPGPITLTATAPSLQSAQRKLHAKP